MRAFVSGILALIFLISVSPGTVAQVGEQEAECTEFQAYWEALVGTLPDDPEGLEALLHIFGAGTLTIITAEQQQLALQFMEAWVSNIEQMDATMIPMSARLFHPDLAQDADFLALSLEFAEPDELSDTFAFTPIGIYVLLIEEAATPSVCA